MTIPTIPPSGFSLEREQERRAHRKAVERRAAAQQEREAAVAEQRTIAVNAAHAVREAERGVDAADRACEAMDDDVRWRSLPMPLLMAVFIVVGMVAVTAIDLALLTPGLHDLLTTGFRGDARVTLRLALGIGALLTGLEVGLSWLLPTDGQARKSNLDRTWERIAMALPVVLPILGVAPRLFDLAYVGTLAGGLTVAALLALGVILHGWLIRSGSVTLPSVRRLAQSLPRWQATADIRALEALMRKNRTVIRNALVTLQQLIADYRREFGDLPDHLKFSPNEALLLQRVTAEDENVRATAEPAAEPPAPRPPVSEGSPAQAGTIEYLRNTAEASRRHADRGINPEADHE